MLLTALVATPLLGGLAALFLRRDGVRRGLLFVIAAAHASMTGMAWCVPARPALWGWIALDAPGLIFLTITSSLFLAVSVYALQFLAHEGPGAQRDFEEDLFFVNAPEAVFTACLLAFLATMTLATLSQHLGLLWLAIESSTLASAPLIYFHRHHRSLEATWKYVLICSVGVALALLGLFLVGLAASDTSLDGSMLVEDLVRHAAQLNPRWLQAAFIFLLVGYGAKMGLAPLHTWLPDAHSEAPSLVSALLSGALLNCAFLGILRLVQVMVGAELLSLAQQLLVILGLFSIGLAGVFILGQTDFKRLLAYSSVEHMGILALGIGLGGVGTFGAMLHTFNHSFAKALLFLVAGNILAVYRSKSIADVRGLSRMLPASSFLWMAGLFAITGSPPFGAFLSEFSILRAALEQQRYGIAAGYLAGLSIVFIGMSRSMLSMAQGPGPEGVNHGALRENWLAIFPPAALAGVTLMLGLYIPPALADLLHDATRLLGGQY